MKLSNQSGTLTIRSITVDDLKTWWNMAYGPKSDLTWMAFNGPYFNDPVVDWLDFKNGYGNRAINNPHLGLIIDHDKIVGLITANWADGDLAQWLEFGIVIYDSKNWHHGIGQEAIRLWIPYLFNLYPYIKRVGFTTWSGNEGMMCIGETLGMKLEARIRKVRFYKEHYYDSVKYGILRNEPLKSKKRFDK